MPAVPGENLLTTLFADVHYYFSDPAARPVHDRFDRGSYVYIYHNPTSHEAKLEIANYAGTPNQDAFSGYLHSARASAQYSYKQPSLFTIKVPSASSDEHAQWHLPAFDPHNEQKYLYKIHSLDIYLWTEKDAISFLRHLKTVLPVDRLDIRDAPAHMAEHRDSMSPVVQQLERTAISTHLPPHRAGSTTSSHHSIPGPPTPAASGGTASPHPVAVSSPMAYNPAAPAAPEPIAHREKTPPPPDAASGTGLSGPPQHGGYGGFNPNQGFMPQQSSFTRFSGPPPAAGGMPPPPPGGPHRQTSLSFSGPPSANSTPQPTSPPPQQHHPSFGPTSQTQYATYNQQQQQPGMPPTPSAPPQYGLHTPLQSPTQPQHQQQQYFQQAQPAGVSSVGGYNTFDYSAGQQAVQQQNQHGAYTGSMHAQSYRPTEAEAKHGHHGKPATPQSSTPLSGGGPPGKKEKDSAIGKRVDGFLKRLDKMI